ncbi:Uncharacterized protein containing a von Willebrand factor type A domain OS=Solibacillus silvestris (strain StLB046) GN=SSIL_2224 PE=4 SV=1: VWA_2 [Gemmataceae bacterium]|nr:Uncharacterized protein containing a von Willebrand factor type A domain OS=Solibacillus silvestris (strain StLB046) GN=SSIL_2224 PE=4 SV=1: VWA_2 [Gemmataceae bacterium]VTT99585.1 Uncharacterized protein containing a von Willebrand factor type A domain OS=Solibacillus silvestris (strain StLB046) GN=SSIL_2224 PE=4 SV=1: VWA_2 [Gemmataceae bacterium]
MDAKDLLKMLDLDGKPPDTPKASGVIAAAGAEPAPPPDASPTALDVDAWGLRRGQELVAESERLRKSGTDPFAAADFFSAAFDPDPKLAGSCADRRRHQFVSQLLDTPEYHALHAATRLDDTAAGIAAAHFAEQFSRLKKEDTKDHAGGAPGDPGDALGDEMATLRAVGRAVAEAGKEVGELHESMAALGMGPGSPGSNDPRAVAELFKRVRGDPTLRRICELAGRFRRVAQSKQRMKASHGLDDIVGVEPSGDVGRLLPGELAKLMIPELELDTLRRIVERQAMCREHHAVEPMGKGPVIICLDESGSMSGTKIHAAKALALALAWVARQQRRWCALVAYSGDSGERLLPLPPSRWDESRLADWLAAFIGHGSDIDVPVREMPRMYAELKAPPGVTDLVFVTDARCRLPAGVRDTFLAWKRAAQARLVTLVIDNQPGDLAHVSDEVHSVRSLTPDSDAVGRVLSL